MPTDPVAAYLAAVDPARRPAVDRLRGIVHGAIGADAVECIKWNAPSFAVGGEDRVTLNLGPKGALRLILHRGARAAAGGDLAFDDPAALAAWPSPDRGVVSLRDCADIEAKAAAIGDLVRRWIAATR